jgi:uncharacterized protein
MTDWNQIARDAAHRPWPVPSSPWAMTMSWVDLLFAHWPVDPAQISRHLPDGLEVDTYEGDAWLSVVPFEMDNTMPRGLTWWPRPMRFAELNLRTYVVADDKPGVWFFSLDAASRAAVRGARAAFYLPYFDADMSIERAGDTIAYESRRTHRGAQPASFSATYEPAGPVELAAPGSLAHWLSERYCLYSANPDGRVYRADVNHPQWPLRPARAQIQHNTLGEPFDLQMPGEPALINYVDRIDVVGWFRRRS